MEWRHSGSPRPKKSSYFNSSRENDAHVFFYENGPLMLECLETGGTVNANRLCDNLRKLKTAIKNRRRGMLSKVVLLLEDNARPHVAKVRKDLLQHFQWEVLHHPPYSPELSP